VTISLADAAVSWKLVVTIHAAIQTLDAGFLHAVLLLLWQI
jgi:hypothetical protein